jgi:RNA polymerase sigma-70 factor, ECF subfamily
VVEEHFEKLVDEFYEPLYRFGVALSRNHADAADLTQQTFYRWATKGHQLQEISKVKTWLFTTLYREFLASKRKGERFVTANEDLEMRSTPSTPSIMNHLDGQTAYQALLSLEENYRAPLILFYLQENSYREIAEILAIPLGTVMSRISRGKVELRKVLSDSNKHNSPGERPATP